MGGRCDISFLSLYVRACGWKALVIEGDMVSRGKRGQERDDGS